MGCVCNKCGAFWALSGFLQASSTLRDAKEVPRGGNFTHILLTRKRLRMFEMMGKSNGISMT